MRDAMQVFGLWLIVTSQVGAAEVVTARLDINAMIAGGQASVTSTPSDIGGVAQLFDGDTGSLYRSANIDPAFVQVAFTQARTLRTFKTLFSHASSYRWKIESADSQADMNSQTGTWAEIVAWTNASDMVVSSVTLGTPRTAKLFKMTAERLVGDNYVHINEWELHGDVTVNALAIVPAAQSLVQGTSFQYICRGTDAGGTVYDLTTRVTWNSSVPSVASIGQTTGLCHALQPGATQIGAALNTLQAPTSALSVTGILSPPSNLQAAGYYSTAHVSWTPISDPSVVGYAVYRRTASSGYPGTPAKRVLVRGSFTDYGLTPGQTYFYKLAAINGNGAHISTVTPEQSVTLRSSMTGLSLHTNFELLMVIYKGGYSQAQVDQMTAGLRKGLEFYWRTSRGRLNMDVTWMYIDGLPPGSDWYSGALQNDLRARGMQDNQYDLAFLAGNNLAGCFGGYVVFGSTCASLGTVCGVPYPGKDPTVNYTIAWTFTHEIHHALEAMENITAGTPEVLFCHFPWAYPDPLGPTGWHVDWGPHFDGIGLTNREYGDNWMLYPSPYNGRIECNDVDEDDLPDNDPRVWMDEARFGSSSAAADTDGDGLSDLGEFSAYNFRGTDPHDTDSDNDGILDGSDPQALYAVPGSLRRLVNPPAIDGTIEAAWPMLSPGYYFTQNVSDFPLTTYAGYDANYLYLAFASTRQLRFMLSLDGSGEDGRFESPVRHTAGATDTDNLDNKGNHYGDSWADGNHIYFYHGSATAEVYGRSTIAGSNVASRLVGGVYYTEARIPRALPAGAAYTWYPSDAPVVEGLRLDPGRLIGLNVVFSNLAGSNGAEYSGTWTSLFEPHSFVDFMLAPADADSDGVPDATDTCPNTVPGSPVDVSGCPPLITGDFDRDGDVDLVDFDQFHACSSGANVPQPQQGCQRADFDIDTDVDQDDFGSFQRCYSGTNVLADQECAT